MEESKASGEPYYIEHSFTKDKYQLVREKEEHAQAAENEIYVTNDGKPNKFYAYGAEYLLRNKDNNLRIKASGKAIFKAFLIAELIRKRVKGLHQITKVDSTDSITKYVSLEEGLDDISITKKLSVVEITLSFEPLDKDHYGYMPPLPEGEVKEIDLEEFLKKKLPFNRRGGRGGRQRRGERREKGEEGVEEDERKPKRGGFQKRGGGDDKERPGWKEDEENGEKAGQRDRGVSRGRYSRGGRFRRGERRHHSQSVNRYERDREQPHTHGERRSRRGGYRGRGRGGFNREEREDRGWGGDRGERGQDEQERPKTFQMRGRGGWKSRGNRGGYNREERTEDRRDFNREDRGEAQREERGGYKNRGGYNREGGEESREDRGESHREERGGYKNRGGYNREGGEQRGWDDKGEDREERRERGGRGGRGERGARRGGRGGENQFRSRDDLWKVSKRGGWHKRGAPRKISGKGEDSWFNKQFEEKKE